MSDGRASLRRGLAACLLVTAVAIGGAGCSTTLLSPEDESRIGREQHPRIIEEFGGAYPDRSLQAYVAGVGAVVAAGSGWSGGPLTFTVLNSPTVNAFALPGGYVYVTRGLLALADSEAELAGVIGHEIGHVVARHGAQQHGRSVIVGLGSAILGAAIGDRAAEGLMTLGVPILRRYSREQEFEADQLGLGYMTRAGYHPEAMATFLGRLRDKSLLEAALMGTAADPDENSLAATHPRTVDRVHEARATALGGGPASGRIERDSYLRRLDGMLYGDTPEQGLVRGQRFVHPVLGFEFTVPPGFVLANSQGAVVARAPAGALILFDTTPAGTPASMLDYVRDQWGAALPLADLTGLVIDGMEAATGAARIATAREPFDLRLLALRGDGGRIHRFLFATPAQDTAMLTGSLQRTGFSFRRLSASEAAAERPYRLRISEARPGDTVATLAQRMPEGPRREARFRVLNGLAPGQEPAPGRLLKHIGF